MKETISLIHDRKIAASDNDTGLPCSDFGFRLAERVRDHAEQFSGYNLLSHGFECPQKSAGWCPYPVGTVRQKWFHFAA